MKKLILLPIFCISAAISFAQPIPHQSIEDSVIGWMKVYNFKGVKAGTKVDDKIYSANQISLCDSFANWIQASYMPKGGLGDVKKSVSEKLGLYNQHTTGKPQSYGAYSKTYFELKYNSSRKMEPFTNSHVWWDISANKIPGDWPVRDICTPTQYYFTMPTAETEVDDEKIKKLLDLKNNANIKHYISFWVKNMAFGGGTENVILCKDNKSPFIQITRGEFLQAWENAIPRYYEAEKKKITEAEQGDQKRIAVAVKYLDEKIAGFNTGIIKNKEKYKNRLGEPAMTSIQPSINDLANGRDVFTGQYLTDPESNSVRYPVYKVDPVMAELCKKDKPQWILISWDYYVYDPTEKQQHEAIISNFNFEYVYNFFFAPEKVKGQPYQPLRSPYTKEAIVVIAASEESKKNSGDKNIHFFENFSTTGIGKKPIGWRTEYGLNGGVVVNPDGLNGNWVLVTGNTLTPNQLKKPLPQNFTLSYELVASQNFTWGAKGLTLQLSKEISPGNAESFLSLKLRPGFDGKDGEATLETKFPAPPGYSNGTKWFVAPGFSNNKKNNHITVTIKKMDEKLQVFIDNTKIAEYEKAIPLAHLFNAMSFYSGNSGENDKFYISNIKITKD
ncbi:MAG TPA: hypothetical protein VIV35_08370 [Chitinophagaceae bacterium]